jgi:hypothetical protein
MTDSGRTDSDLRPAARAALEASARALLDSEEYADLEEILPATFVDHLLDIAWRHQFDLDRVRFRREIKNYIHSIAVDAARVVES